MKVTVAMVTGTVLVPWAAVSGRGRGRGRLGVTVVILRTTEYSSGARGY